MLINPHDLYNDLDRLEEIEKSSLRLVVQAIFDYRHLAQEIFQNENDQVADIGEDVTREALDRLGMSKIDQRLFGKVDYKRARYLFHPSYAVKQALFVDSKAEKTDGQATATLQITQTSLSVRQIRSKSEVDIPGKLPKVISISGEPYICTTIFVKYNYEKVTTAHELRSVTVAALPNGMLQDKYNPTPVDNVWLAGRNAPSLGEEFRVRLDFGKLKSKAKWRVQSIPMSPDSFVWSE